MNKTRRKGKTRKLLATLLASVMCIIFAASFVSETVYASGAGDTEDPISIEIVSAGDTLAHMPLQQNFYDAEFGTYDFSPLFSNIKHYFNGDLNIVNLETPLAGQDKGYSGYPTFNCPMYLAFDLVNTLGIDVVSTANNHCMDKGISGLEKTLENLDEVGLAHAGTSRTPEEQNDILMYEIKGIKTAVLSYTYGTNGIQVPSDKAYAVNTIDKDFIKSQINSAKDLGAELIIACMHWGNEYELKPSSYQKELAEFLIANDVKVILGCHPHVLQPMEMKRVETENGVKEGLVIYSQGNFFSNQTQAHTQESAIFKIKLEKADGKISVKSAEAVPIYMQNDKSKGSPDRYKIIDLTSIVMSYDAGESFYSKEEAEGAANKISSIRSIVGENIYNVKTE